MLRKLLTIAALTLLGIGITAGVASAAPGDPPGYPAAGVVTVAVDQTIVLNGGGDVSFSGEGFLPGETIDITDSFTGPSGLRSNRALVLASSAAMQKTVADSGGHFADGIHLTQVGIHTLTATGETSGRTATLTVTVVAGSSGTEGTTTVPGETSSTTGAAAGAAGDGSGSGSTGTGDGLASAGVSIAGPLTVGAAALLVGLGLLFFGTRLVIRRKHGTPGT